MAFLHSPIIVRFDLIFDGDLGQPGEGGNLDWENYSRLTIVVQGEAPSLWPMGTAGQPTPELDVKSASREHVRGWPRLWQRSRTAVCAHFSRCCTRGMSLFPLVFFFETRLESVSVSHDGCRGVGPDPDTAARIA